MKNPLVTLVCALDNIVGPGSQHEQTCDRAEHNDDSACVWCEARAALAVYRADQNDCAQRLIDAVNITGGLVSFENGTVAPLADPDWIDLGEVYLRACDEKGIEPVITRHEGADDAP